MRKWRHEMHIAPFTIFARIKVNRSFTRKIYRSPTGGNANETSIHLDERISGRRVVRHAGCAHRERWPAMSKFRHECPDWDYLEIDEDAPEFGVCTCEMGQEAAEIREEIWGEPSDENG
jgi:hypothetical protein